MKWNELNWISLCAEENDCIEMGILFRKLFWLLWEKIVLVIEKCFGKIEAEGREFAIVFRSLEQFDWIVKDQNNFWYRLLLTNNWNVETYRNNLENGMVGNSKYEYICNTLCQVLYIDFG